MFLISFAVAHMSVNKEANYKLILTSRIDFLATTFTFGKFNVRKGENYNSDSVPYFDDGFSAIFLVICYDLLFSKNRENCHITNIITLIYRL
jgi:hypothetical protein